MQRGDRVQRKVFGSCVVTSWQYVIVIVIGLGGYFGNGVILRSQISTGTCIKPLMR